MILIECDADEFLIKKLGFPRNKIRHERGRDEVLKKLKKSERGIGVVDEDPNSAQSNELKSYNVVELKSTLALLERQRDKDKKLIRISPRFEEWLLKRSKLNKIKPTDFNLPNNGNELHKIPHYEKRNNFERFLLKLIEVDEELLTMKQWIEQSI